MMNRKRKISFEELVQENKDELLKDLKALERIEAKLERKHLQKAESNITCFFLICKDYS